MPHRKIFIILLFCLTGLSTRAQRFGLKAGVNYSNARVYDSATKISSGYKAGATFGAMADFEFDGPLHFTPSIMYSMKGYSFKPIKGTRQEISTTFHYLELGAILSFNIPAIHKGFALNAGPTASFAFSGKEKITENGVTNTSDIGFSLVKDYGFYDMGMFMGASYSFQKWMLQAGYQLNFININNNAETDQLNIRNRTLSLTFGYFLR